MLAAAGLDLLVLLGGQVPAWEPSGVGSDNRDRVSWRKGSYPG